MCERTRHQELGCWAGAEGIWRDSRRATRTIRKETTVCELAHSTFEAIWYA
jgi:hypothetical protein